MIYGQGIDTQRYTYGLDVLSLDTWNKSLSTWNQNCAKAITAKKADRSYYLQDELGSPIRIIGEAGNTKARYSYDAFGRPIIPVNLISRSKTRGNIYSYTGYQYDLSTGLMYAQARYYMPEVGRFISADAYKGTVTDPQSLNLYVYCANNPVNYVDPSGYYTVGLRDSLSSCDSISWNSRTRTATATINGITRNFAVDSDSNVWIENGRVKMDSSYFYQKFGSVSKVYSDYLVNHPQEIGYAKQTSDDEILISVFTGGAGAVKYLGKKAITKVATNTTEKTLKMNLQLFAKSDIKQIIDAANQVGVNRQLFGKYIHEIKASLGRKPNENFTYQELLKYARELKKMLRK
ncbi:MAG: RHS repeat-associated core domain-containing protein [Desulfitobacteriaceae bacterium]|nr:RHS repeat-associated core domain-containing protein [Desulfitobacteriaceae bacterium]